MAIVYYQNSSQKYTSAVILTCDDINLSDDKDARDTEETEMIVCLVGNNGPSIANDGCIWARNVP